MSKHLSYVEDVDSNWVWQDAHQNQNWNRLDKNVFSLGYVAHPVWLKVRFIPEVVGRWHGVISYLTLDKVDYYWIKDGILIKHDESGDLRSFAQRVSKGREISSYLDIATKEPIELYIRIETQGAVLVPLSLQIDEYFIKQSSRSDIFLGTYYGLLLVMAFYNLVLFFITRIASYFFYTAYLFTSLFSRAPLDAPAFMLLWPQNPEINQWMLPVMFWLAAIAYWSFAYHFLNVSHSPHARRWLFYPIYTWIAILGVLYWFMDYAGIVKLLTLTSALILLLGFIYACFVAWKTERYAGIFALATFSSVIAYVANALGVSGYVSDPLVAIYGYPIGRTIEVILFAAALGVRIRTIHKLKDQAEQEKAATNESSIKSLQQYQRLYDHSLVGHALLDVKGRIVKANRAFTHLLSINPYQDCIYEYIDKNALLASIEKIQGESRQSQSDVIGLNQRWYSVMLNRIDADDLKELYGLQSVQGLQENPEFIQAYECSIVDITDRKKLAEARAHLEQDKMNALQSLVVGVAHEINTPLGIMRTATDHIRENLETTLNKFREQKLTKNEFSDSLEQGQQTLALSLQNCERLGEMVKSFKQVSVTQLNYRFGELDVATILDMFSQKVEQLGYRLVTNVTALPGLVFTTYPAAVAAILEELLTNVVDHGVADHGVDKAHSASAIEINLKIEQTADQLSLSFSDNGLGLTELSPESIFDPFVTTKRGANQKLGLGLYQVHNIVKQLLKGDIRCESAKPLTFKIVLPNFTVLRF